MSAGLACDRVSVHAVARYLERVDRHASVEEAQAAIAQILLRGKRSPRARRWMRDGVAHPGRLYVYDSRSPGVCVIVVDGTAVTVVARGSCRRRRRQEPQLERRSVSAPGKRWRWDGFLPDPVSY